MHFQGLGAPFLLSGVGSRQVLSEVLGALQATNVRGGSCTSVLGQSPFWDARGRVGTPHPHSQIPRPTRPPTALWLHPKNPALNGGLHPSPETPPLAGLWTHQTKGGGPGLPLRPWAPALSLVSPLFPSLTPVFMHSHSPNTCEPGACCWTHGAATVQVRRPKARETEPAALGALIPAGTARPRAPLWGPGLRCLPSPTLLVCPPPLDLLGTTLTPAHSLGRFFLEPQALGALG